MTIAGLARAAGVGVETIRYYQRRGLLLVPNTGAGPTGRVRQYGSQDLRRLWFIRAAQSAGFTLEQIHELLELDAVADRQKIRSMAEERVSALDRKISELRLARRALHGLAIRCSVIPPGPCPIVNAFNRTGSEVFNVGSSEESAPQPTAHASTS